MGSNRSFASDLEVAPSISPQSASPLTLDFEDNRLLVELYGAQGENLLRIEELLGVSIANRGNRVVVEGAPGTARGPVKCCWACMSVCALAQVWRVAMWMEPCA